MFFLARAAATVALIFAAPSVFAANIYSTGFEPPTYATGSLIGQDGWQSTHGPTAASVETSVVHSGTQAVQFFANTNTAAGQTDLGHPGSFDATNEIVTVNTSFRISSSTSESQWAIGASQTDGSYDGGLALLPGGSMYVFGSGFLTTTFADNTWYTLSLVFNFQSETYNVFLNGSTIATNATMSNTGNTFNTPLYTSYGSATANDSMYLDDISIQATGVPEPRFVFAGGLVMLALVLVARVRSRVSAR